LDHTSRPRRHVIRIRHATESATQPPVTPPGLAVEPVATAAGLRYVCDADPGIRRRRAGRGFSYSSPDGARITDPSVLARIRSLAIPPAWTDVWICPNPLGHIQATGRDARGRKQYRYHPRWRQVRDETKYHRLVAFARALPRMRARVDRDLALPALPRQKVLAAVVRLLEETRMRVGNEEYAQQNGSFGLTTLRSRHATVDGTTVRFQFRGKSGRRHTIDLRDRRLARIVRRCRDLPGQHLFRYRDDEGGWESIDSDDVNDYLREASGEAVTTKDFRTWAGTLLAYESLARRVASRENGDPRHDVVEVIREVSDELGNTPAVSRRSYIHPGVVDAYLEGSLVEAAERGGAAKASDARDLETVDGAAEDEADAPAGLHGHEVRLLAFLERQAVARDSRPRAARARKRPGPAAMTPARNARPPNRHPG
jgi:DNA topoisomerase-1